MVLKKAAAILLAVLVMLTSPGCYAKHIAIEQSASNFEKYKESIETVLKKYNYVLTETTYPSRYEVNLYYTSYKREFSVGVNKETKIEIGFNTDAINGVGVERFSIDYITQLSSEDDVNKNINVTLFVELVNAVSGRQITQDYCSEFLNATESKYPASDYGFDKLTGEKIYKMRPLNFFEEWTLEYILYSDFLEKLSIIGLTKQLTE